MNKPIYPFNNIPFHCYEDLKDKFTPVQWQIINDNVDRYYVPDYSEDPIEKTLTQYQGTLAYVQGHSSTSKNKKTP